MNFQSIRYFLQVAKRRSFSQAAEELFITQQTLSASIASLEKELGCRLFIRHIPLELTYGGRWGVFVMTALVSTLTAGLLYKPLKYIGTIGGNLWKE